MIGIGDTNEPECQSAIPAAIRRFDASIAAMHKAYGELSHGVVMKFGAANDNRPVKHAGWTGMSYLELAMESAAEWRIQIAAKIDPTNPVDRLEALNFIDADAISSWREISVAPRIKIDFMELTCELVAESRRVWINDGRKGNAPGRRGRKSTLNDDLVILHRIESGSATPKQIAKELKVDISTVSKKVKRARLSHVKK